MNPLIAQLAAQLAMSALAYNQDVKNAANAARRDEVYIRGGEWSNMKPQGYEQPNFWGNMSAGLTSGLMAQQNQKKAEQEDALLKAILGRQQSGENLDFSVPSSSSFGSGNRYSLGAWG